MSYCRFGPDSDVYVFQHVGGGWECCGCLFGDSLRAETREEMLSHLEDHIKTGHTVPEHAIARLKAEIENRPYETDVEKGLRLLWEEKGLNEET